MCCVFFHKSIHCFFQKLRGWITTYSYNISYPLIGRKLGGKDHTTVMHSCERVEKELKDNPLLAQDIGHIRSMLATL